MTEYTGNNRSDRQNFTDCLYGQHWAECLHPWFNGGFSEHGIGFSFTFLNMRIFGDKCRGHRQ